MSRDLKIGIVGAGLGGTTAAVALQQRGFQVVVYEQAPQLDEVGAGITVGPNATRVLAALGLEDEIQALASATPHVGTLDYRTAERLSYVPRGAAEYLRLYGAVVRHMHRADMHTVLLNALDAEQDCLRLDHRLVQIQQNEERVTLQFENGQVDDCDVVVACDGIKSLIRDRLFATEPPEFTGYVAWRGLVERKRVPDVSVDPHFASFAAENKNFARYPVCNGTLINYVAVARMPEFKTESWNARADISEVLPKFAGWHKDVIQIIEATPAEGCLRWALHTRQPLNTWTEGRVTLLGDAAHPMTPFLGMGAAMAIEDAAVLARCFEAANSDWEDALRRYERARLDRANQIHMDSDRRGQEMFGSDPKGRAKPPGVGLDEVYMYDAMQVAI